MNAALQFWGGLGQDYSMVTTATLDVTEAHVALPTTQ